MSATLQHVGALFGKSQVQEFLFACNILLGKQTLCASLVSRERHVRADIRTCKRDELKDFSRIEVMQISLNRC